MSIKLEFHKLDQETLEALKELGWLAWDKVHAPPIPKLGEQLYLACTEELARRESFENVKPVRYEEHPE